MICYFYFDGIKTKSGNPELVEQVLMNKFAKCDCRKLHLSLIFQGDNVCHTNCSQCATRLV